MRRIGVNLAWMVPGVVGGSEDSTVAALQAVREPARDAGFELVLFGLPSLREAHPDLVEHHEFVELAVGGGNRVLRVLAENTQLARRMEGERLLFAHHAGGVVPPRVTLPAVLAIHDTQPLDLPANFSLVKRRYLGRMIGRSVRSALAVTVPSEFVRGRVIAGTGVDPDRVVVVPWSVRPASVPAPAPDSVAAVVRRRGLHRPYVLYPAIAYVHKNHATLLEAMARLTGGADGGRADPGVDLVLTGGPGPCDEAVAARIRRPDLQGRVHVLGRVDRGELDALLAGAAVVAVPSRYEGFGLPALEAMAAGRPVVVARAGSLPEVVGDAGLVVPPDDVDAWAEALASVLHDEVVASRLVAAGRTAAASWSPQRTAAGLVDVWTRVAERLAAPADRPNPAP